MPDLRIKRFGNVAEISLKLPWEMAELLVDVALPVLQELAESPELKAKRERRDEAHRQAETAERVKRTQEQLAKNISLGRRIDRFLRQYFREAQAKGRNISRPILKSEALKAWRGQFGGTIDQAEYCISRFRSDLKKRIKARRAREIFRCMNRGLSNAEIGKRYGYHPVTISKILGKERKRRRTARRGGK